ncbi:hypothetical protein MASR2M70_05750 [Bacillota bacterium]
MKTMIKVAALMCIALTVLFAGTMAASAGANGGNLTLENYQVTLINKVDGSLTAEIILEMKWVGAGENTENTDLIYALYKGNRVVNVVKKTISLTDEGFYDRTIFNLQSGEKPDSCKAFILQGDSWAPLTNCQIKKKNDVGFTEVDEVFVAGINLNKEDTIIAAGSWETLVATITPAGATNKTIAWSSSDETIATVSSSGLVTGIKVGTATITASSEDGGFTASCDVVIKLPVTRGELADFVAKNFDLLTIYPGEEISDIEGHEYESSIVKVVEAGILRLYPDGTFNPYKKVQRAEFAVVVTRLLESQDVDLSDLKTLPYTISDLSDDAWYYPYMCVAINLSIIEPDGSNLVYPESEIIASYLSQNTITSINDYVPEDKIAYVLNTKNAYMDGEEYYAYVTLLLSDGTSNSFFVEERRFSELASNGIMNNDDQWNISTGSVVFFGTGARNNIIVMNEKEIDAENVSGDILSKGYFDGRRINDNAFIVLYYEKGSSYSDDYIVTTLDKIAGNPASGVDYSVDNNQCIDFMLVHYVPVTEVQLNKTILIMEAGGSDVLEAAVLPDNANIQGLVWTSSDPTIAEVNADGWVVGVSPGSAVITVKSIDGNIEKTCNVKVTESISNITLNKSKITLIEGNSEKLFSSVTPGNFLSQIHWSSSDEWVAEVSDEGLITAISPGTTTITARLENGKKAASCHITVESSTIYGVIISVARTNSDYGYEIEMLVEGKQMCFESINLINVDMKKLYTASLDEKGAVIGVATVTPDIQIDQGEIISVSGGIVKYGTPEKIITISSEVVVYKMNESNKYGVGTINDALNKAANFYDFDNDRVFDIVLLPN